MERSPREGGLPSDRRDRRRERWFLLLVGALALSIRLGYAGWYIGAGYAPELDAREYSDLAASLASGQGYRLANGQPTAIRPPFFPLILAGVYRVAGMNHRAGLILQAVIGAATVLAAYAVGKRACGAVAGRLAGLIAATYPLLIYIDGSLLTEPLFLLLVTLTMAAGLRTLELPVLGNHLALGSLLGLAWLTRPNGAFLLPFVLLWLLVASRERWGYRLAGAAVIALTALVVTMPWIARNYLVFGKIIPFSTMGGAVLYGSYNDIVLNDPQLRGDWVSPCEVPGAGWSCQMDEVERDAAWQGLGLAFIRNHLTDLPKLAWWRFVKFWHFYPFTHGFPENVGFYYYVLVAGLAAVGAWLTRRAWRRTGLLLAVIACFTISAILSWGGYRMRIPVETALIVLAAAAVTRLWSARHAPKP